MPPDILIIFYSLLNCKSSANFALTCKYVCSHNPNLVDNKIIAILIQLKQKNKKKTYNQILKDRNRYTTKLDILNCLNRLNNY